MKKYEAIAANSKMYFGNDIPSMFVDSSSSPTPAVTAATMTGQAAAKKAKNTKEGS